MIKVWAEKEFRNLKRLFAAGIRVPDGIILRENVLLMEFIGDGYNPAPRLRDANLD